MLLVLGLHHARRLRLSLGLEDLLVSQRHTSGCLLALDRDVWSVSFLDVLFTREGPFGFDRLAALQL